MSQLQSLKTSLKESVEQLSEANLQLAYQFINNLAEQEREEATA
ncbi:MAG: hypothetical protein WBM32_18560 [Crocosphaera sp.]